MVSEDHQYDQLLIITLICPFLFQWHGWADEHMYPLLTYNFALVVVAAKTTSDASSIPASSFPPDPNSSASTINTVAREISEAGGSALALPVDVRDVDNVTALVDEVARRLGRLDVLVYNSGAIWWSAVETTPVKRFMLLQQVNPQGLYAAVSAALPHFGKQAWKGRIIVVSPPIYSRFFRGKTAYAIGKVGMSVLTKGLAMDFVRQGRKDMAITSIWPAAVSDNQLHSTYYYLGCVKT
jgi:NAD(P)-dependent dehydrogenase (short-subunit alcohol dehydrogenase family)